MPLVSVIVPAYNHERYLEERLQSVFRQHFTDYEVILLDDCSTDGSREILKSYQYHPNVSHVCFNETNSGSPFRQWKKGIALAKGEWIWIAETDDYCDEKLLDSLVKQALQNPGVVLSYCQSKEVDENGNGWRDMSWHTDKIDKNYWKTDYFNNGLDEIKKCLWHFNSIPNASAVIFKKDAYLACDNGFEKMKMCGDWMLWVQLLKKGNIVFCAKPHNSFRSHSDTTRVLADKEKIKRRFEEEYIIATEIETVVKDLKPTGTQKRWRMAREYCTLFSTSEMAAYLRKPWTYKKPVPLLMVSSLFFLRLLKTKTQKLFKTKLQAGFFFY